MARVNDGSPMCPLMRTYWRHLANTIELVLPSAYPSPQPKRHLDRLSRFCRAHYCDRPCYSVCDNRPCLPT